MPVLDKQKLLAFSKRKAATPLAAGALAAKRAQAAKPPQYQLGPDGQPLLDANGQPIPLPPPPAPMPGAAAAPPPPAHAPVLPHPGAHAGPQAGLPPPKPKASMPPPHSGAPPAPQHAAPPPHAAPPKPGGMAPPPKVMPMKPPMPPGHAEQHAEAPHPGEDHEMQIYELVEDAAQAAEGALDQELEDTIAGSDSKGPEDVPKWALDPEKWKEAAEAVGLGIEGVQEKYEEPYVVTAYLYKMIGGPIAADGQPGAEGAAPKSAGETDMTKKGAAASALQARAAARPPQ